LSKPGNRIEASHHKAKMEEVASLPKPKGTAKEVQTSKMDHLSTSPPSEKLQAYYHNEVSLRV
jgi:hypothetical protein